MKKLATLFAAAMLTVSVSAQTVQESKTFDNVYLGINAGLATKTTDHASWAKDLTPNFGVRLGRNFTPVWGLAVESNIYFKTTNGFTTGTFVNFMNTSLLGTTNFSNWFGGYKGEPRAFEVSAVYGLGWGHMFTNNREEFGKMNNLTSKVGLDFAFNLGQQKAWQLYIEPSLNYALNGDGYQGVQYNIDRSAFQLNVGLVYKFKNSNGTHNFAIATGRDQSEIDALNAKINSLRSDLDDQEAKNKQTIADKDKQISDLQKALEDCQNKPAPKAATVTNLQPTVIFGQGKSSVDAAQYAPIELIANYMKNHKDAKVEIKGYASPEGSKEINEKLSVARAEAVKNILVKRYKISADRLTTKGMGATDKLFEQVEFNRVATFNDVTKD